MAHWEYILWALSSPIGLAAWRYAPRAFLMIVGGMTSSPQRSWQCKTMVILSRRDAKEILKYLAHSPELAEPPPAEAGSRQTTIRSTG
jgi:hypothetical protein